MVLLFGQFSKYLTYREDSIPQQSRVCTKYGIILSNYTGDFYVCDDFEDVERIEL